MAFMSSTRPDRAEATRDLTNGGAHEMRTLITIHGISTEGAWQDDVEKDVFLPHFRCVNIKYWHFRRLGVLKLILEPLVAAIGGLAILISWYLGQITPWITAVALGLVGLGAMLAAPVRRILALRQVKRQFSPHSTYGHRPHIIAHSLGTYFVAQVLRKFSDPRAGRVVLTGCVLSRYWDWATLRHRNPHAFETVRNEVAGLDAVPRLARLLERLVPGFGLAGAVGFDGPPTLIHTVLSNDSCPDCAREPESTVLVHNVVSPRHGHSDTFVGEGHAANFWLPWLWGIQPGEYQRFTQLCDEAFDRQENGNEIGLRDTETRLRDTRWEWAGMPLKDYVQRHAQIRSEQRGVPVALGSREVDLVVGLTWMAISAAAKAAREKHAGWEVEARKLHPHVAVAAAARVVLG